MPLKRRIHKTRKYQISAKAREIWASKRKEMIILFSDGSGLVCDAELASELNVPQLITLPGLQALVDALSRE